MRVAIMDPSKEGGIIDYTTSLINELSKKADITLIKGKGSKYGSEINSLELLNARSWQSTQGKINRLKIIVKNFFSMFKTLLLIKDFDIIHVEWDPFIPFSNTFLKICSLFNKKTVWTVHNLFPHESSSLLNNYYKNIYSVADSLITHTQEDKNMLVSMGIKKEKINIIPHGEYGCLYKEYNIKKSEAKKKLKIKGKTVLFFGNIRKYKGLDYLINAMKSTNATLIVAGYSGQKELLINKLKDSSIKYKDLIKFLTPKEVGLVFSAADVLALPYLSISQSGVLFIGLGYKLPIVASNIAGLKEVVNDNIGLRVEPGNVKSLHSAINKVLKGDFFLKKKEYNAELEKYSWKNISEKTMKLYEKLLNQ